MSKSYRRIITGLAIILVSSLACRFGTSVPPTDDPTSIPPSPTPRELGPCNNIFYPFVQGSQWIYLVSGVQENSRIGLSVAGVEDSQAMIDMLDLSTGLVTQSIVDCQDQAIVNLPLLTLGTLFGDIVAGEMTVEHVSGVFMPAEQEFVSAGWDLDWEGEYLAAGRLVIQDEGEEVNIILNDSPIRIFWQMEGQEQVSVPADTYNQAYRIRRETTMDVSVDLDGIVVAGQLVLVTIQWHVPYVGMVKTEVDSAHLVYRSLTFPLQLDVKAELVEFRDHR
ncbi:MAG: hypothetical protein ABIJ39_00095 [Chloroflexota bacterium]